MLTDLKIRSLKPTLKPYKKYDQRGLFLKVCSAGAKLWRLRYQFAGKSKEISLGLYPIVGVAEARRKRDGYLEQIRDGIDPAAKRWTRKSSVAKSSVRWPMLWNWSSAISTSSTNGRIAWRLPRASGTGRCASSPYVT